MLNRSLTTLLPPSGWYACRAQRLRPTTVTRSSVQHAATLLTASTLAARCHVRLPAYVLLLSPPSLLLASGAPRVERRLASWRRQNAHRRRRRRCHQRRSGACAVSAVGEMHCRRHGHCHSSAATAARRAKEWTERGTAARHSRRRQTAQWGDWLGRVKAWRVSGSH